jgi:hypothetical protein
MKVFALLGGALVVAAVAGVVLDVLAFLVARYGPQADGWSFRGNGALAIPFGLGPAVLAGFWTALVLRYRGFARWLELGFAAGLVGTGFLLISVIVLVLFNSAAMDVSSAMTFFILAWLVAAPVLAALIPGPGQSPHSGQLAAHLAACGVMTVAFGLAFFAAGLFLAPGS